ncbi:hypothetical protein T484DRAFT_1833001, partial [Baffinella frigidus]
VFFSEAGPYQSDLREVLWAYARERPKVGYVQGMSHICSSSTSATGMSHIAALLLLHLPPKRAFALLVHTLDRHHFPAFFLMDMGGAYALLVHTLDRHHFPAFFLMDMARIDRYAAASDVFLARSLPLLHARLKDLGVETRIYTLEVCT